MLKYFKTEKEFQKAVTETSIAFCEDVMSNMGAEIHDDLIQRLTILRLYLDRIERSRSDLAETELLIAQMQADFINVVDSVRRISRQLFPNRMEGETLFNCIELLQQSLERPGTGTVHLNCIGRDIVLPQEVEIHILRIVQELIHNAIKHSSAWHVWILIENDNHSLKVEVEDDGTGFIEIAHAIAALNRKYNTLRMRSDLLGATIKYQNGKKGLIARLSMPLTAVVS